MDIVKDRLDSLSTTSSRVYEDTASAIQASDLPALVIEPLSETVTGGGGISAGGRFRKQQRELRIAITGLALTRAQADQIALEVEPLMEGLPMNEDGALGPMLESVGFDAKLGEKRIFAVQLIYLIRYFTAGNAPATGL